MKILDAIELKWSSKTHNCYVLEDNKVMIFEKDSEMDLVFKSDKFVSEINNISVPFRFLFDEKNNFGKDESFSKGEIGIAHREDGKDLFIDFSVRKKGETFYIFGRVIECDVPDFIKSNSFKPLRVTNRNER
jgi:uncharacterized protein (DUF1684 family)